MDVTNAFTGYGSTEIRRFHRDAACQLEIYIVYDNNKVSFVQKHTKAGRTSTGWTAKADTQPTFTLTREADE